MDNDNNSNNQTNKEETTGPGRPSLLPKDTKTLKQIEDLARLGFTDKHIADAMGVTERTLNNWKKDPVFFSVLRRGKLEADIEIIEALHSKAKGIEYVETTVIRKPDPSDKNKPGNIISFKQVKKKSLPDTGAGAILLASRLPSMFGKNPQLINEQAGEESFDNYSDDKLLDMVKEAEAIINELSGKENEVIDAEVIEEDE